MSLTASFYSALSGLDTNSTALQVISDNIANLNTAGFKGSSVQFEDVLGQSLTTVSGAYGIGVGTKISSVDDNFTQGTLDTTNVGTDVAANGKGFFILKDQGTDENYYTRAGHFYVDDTGYYVNSQGMRVQGYLYDNTGANQVQTLADIKIDQSSMVAPKVTSAVNMGLNVNASDTNTTFDITNPGGTSSYSTALTIYDTLGNAHTITTYFSKEATSQTWQWNATIDGSDVSGGTAGTPVLYGSGTLTFNTSGALSSTMPENFYGGSGITFADGVAASADTIDFTGSTQFGSSSTIQTLNQDGYAAGTLSGVSVNGDGNIVGTYTNGQVKNIAQLVLADFPNLNGLTKAGSTLYQSSTNSGDALVNKPGVGGTGTISSGMLEESNTDLAGEFVKMIITQRAYQANSKVISTTDEMLVDLINSKQ